MDGETREERGGMGERVWGRWEHGGEGEREEGVEGEKGRERGEMWRREMRRGRLREAVAKVMCRGEAFGWPCYAVTSGLVVLCLCVVELWRGGGGRNTTNNERTGQDC